MSYTFGENELSITFAVRNDQNDTEEWQSGRMRRS